MPTAQDVINKLLNEAIVTWTKITKTDPGKLSFSFTKVFDGHELNKALDDLNTSRELDLSGLTTGLLLHGYLTEFLKDMTFSGFQIVKNYEEVLAQVQPFRELEEKIFRSPLAIYIEEYKDQLLEAGVNYGYSDIPALKKFLQRPMAVAAIRRDALASLRKFEAHQFVQSESPTASQLRYNKNIFEFWNVNSIIGAAGAQRLDGLTMVLVREPRAVFSYFVFVIKNTNTITILTDRDKAPHPDYQNMTRRPERELFRREAEHWFPYQLLKFEVAANGKDVTFEDRTGIVPLKSIGVSIGSIVDLPVEQFVWAMLVFDLLNEEYGKNHKLLPELSYTGEMVAVPNLLTVGDRALVAASSYKPLEVEISPQTASQEGTAHQWEEAPVGHNLWMEARYESQVSPALYDPALLFDGAAAEHRLMGDVELSMEETFRRNVLHEKSRKDLHIFRGDSFGSAQEIKDDVLWTVRANKMRLIQKLAEQEYERDKDKIQSWYDDRVRARKEELLNGLARLDVTISFVKAYLGIHKHGRGELQRKNCLKTKFGKSLFRSWGTVPIGNWNRCGEGGYCSVKPTVSGEITISCPSAFADILDMPFDELPWPFHNLFEDDPYSGNHILRRLDPQDWALHNPWTALHRNITIFSCKRHFDARRKAQGLARFIPKEEEDD